MKILYLNVFLLIFSGCITFTKITPANVQVSAGDKANAVKLFKEGAALLYKNDQEALLKFLAAKDLDPMMVAAYYNASVAYEQLGKDEEASALYEQCLDIKEQEGSCLENLVVVKLRLKDDAYVENILDKYLKKFPEEPFVLVAKAKELLLKGSIVESEKYALKAIEREANNLEALYVMMRIFFMRKQFAAAKMVGKNALELAPSHGAIHLWLGHTFTEMELLHDALDAYEQAVDIEPTPEALESYGLLLLKFGRIDEALKILERLSALRPKVEANWLHLGNAYLAKKDFLHSHQNYVKVLELNPDNKDVLFNLGLLYMDLKPENIEELTRLKTSQEYFKKYLAANVLSKEKKAEVDGYLETLAQKIEMEESALEYAKQVSEEEQRQKSEQDMETPTPQENGHEKDETRAGDDE